MSVGLPGLREDAATVRQGAIAKGEDPARVDEALALDRQRREALGEAGRPRTPSWNTCGNPPLGTVWCLT